ARNRGATAGRRSRSTSRDRRRAVRRPAPPRRADAARAARAAHWRRRALPDGPHATAARRSAPARAAERTRAARAVVLLSERWRAPEDLPVSEAASATGRN